jgi:hypothetical protein
MIGYLSLVFINSTWLVCKFSNPSLVFINSTWLVCNFYFLTIPSIFENCHHKAIVREVIVEKFLKASKMIGYLSLVFINSTWLVCKFSNHS